jgi:RimK family alpha-L-glutamate ligase
MMRRLTLGYIHFGEVLDDEDRIFLKLAKIKKIELIRFNAFYEIDENELAKNVKKCKIILNNSAEVAAVELAKTIQILGGKVIDSPNTYYYPEDKWMFFVECKKNHIPTPETILLSEKMKIASQEVKKFSRWPLILKRVSGTCGEYVGRADNFEEVKKVIEKFWKKGSEKLPIIAQEFIHSPTYRVTVIGDEIVQTILKKNSNWKATGVYAKRVRRFKVDKDLKSLIKKILKVTKIKISGIDLLKKDNKWLVLEINAQPAFSFVETEKEKLIKKVFKFLIKEAKNK